MLGSAGLQVADIDMGLGSYADSYAHFGMYLCTSGA